MPLQSDSIHVIGPMLTQADGYAFSNRNLIKTLAMGGYKLKLSPLEPNIPNSIQVADAFIRQTLEASKELPDFDIQLNCAIPPVYRITPGKINLAYTTWETSSLPQEWVSIINKLTAVIVPSNAVGTVFKNSGVTVPIISIPNIVDVHVGDSISVMPSEKKTYTYMFSGNWIPRKNFDDLIQAFSFAFNGNKDVGLVLKTWSVSNDAGGRAGIEQAVRHMANKLSGIDRPRIHLVTDIIEDIDIIKMIKGCDVYVTASRGEGFDLALAQAMAMGKLVITDKFLGHSDYVTQDNALVYDHYMRPVVESSTQFQNAQQSWATPNFESLVNKFRESYRILQNKDTTLGDRAAKDMASKYHLVPIFNSFKSALDQLIKQNDTAPVTKSTRKPLVSTPQS